MEVFLLFEANVVFEERRANKCSSSPLGVDADGGGVACFVISPPLYYRFPLFFLVPVPAAFGFLRSALFCYTYFHTFTASSLSLSERPTYLYSPFLGSKLIGWGK